MENFSVPFLKYPWILNKKKQKKDPLIKFQAVKLKAALREISLEMWRFRVYHLNPRDWIRLES